MCHEFANRMILSLARLTLALATSCAGFCGVVSADAIYLKERVVNSAQPGARQTAFPSEKTAAYDNPVGLPVACEVASRYQKEFPRVGCGPSATSLPPMQRVHYPASLAMM